MDEASDGLRAAKQRVRAEVAGSMPDDLAGASALLVARLEAVVGRTDRVITFSHLPDEPDLSSFVRPSMLLTRTPEEGWLTIHAADAQLERHRWGFLQPVAGCEEVDPEELGIPSGITAFAGHTRAFLKIQDGCDLRCSYCIIPSVRGDSRSLAPDLVLRRLSGLTESGYREIVFTGVNTGDYGRDLVPPVRLHDLLRRALQLPGIGRLRLNSLEPKTVTPEVIELLAGNRGRLARHLQPCILLVGFLGPQAQLA